MFTKTNAVSALQKKSTDVLSLFHKSIASLREVNKASEQEIADREEDIKRLNDEVADLHGIRNQNTSIIAKMNGLLTIDTEESL